MNNKGLHQYRFKQNPLEKEFAEEWDKVNSLESFGIHTIDYLLADEINKPNGEVTKRDREVAATVIQWLGSPIGQGFVENILNKRKLRNVKHNDRYIIIKKCNENCPYFKSHHRLNKNYCKKYSGIHQKAINKNIKTFPKFCKLEKV